MDEEYTPAPAVVLPLDAWETLGRKPVALLRCMVAVAQRAGSVWAGEDDPGMPQNFLASIASRKLLLPPSVREWLRENLAAKTCT